jgi:hypothetical protein
MKLEGAKKMPFVHLFSLEKVKKGFKRVNYDSCYITEKDYIFHA